jgi:hypothetical protein
MYSSIDDAWDSPFNKKTHSSDASIHLNSDLLSETPSFSSYKKKKPNKSNMHQTSNYENTIKRIIENALDEKFPENNPIFQNYQKYKDIIILLLIFLIIILFVICIIKK